MKRAFAAGALAFAGIAATTVAVAPTATAAPSGADACVTSGVTTDYRSAGTVRYKSSSSGCNDLNLTYSNDTSSLGWDRYAGLYRTSNGVWHVGSKGYVYAADGSHSINDSTYWLVTNLAGGTPFSVASYYDGGDYVQITH